MTAINLRYIYPGYQIQNELNCNFSDIQGKFSETLSRNATTSNQMNAPLDMNGYPILNASIGPDPLIPETIYGASISSGVLTIDPKKFMSTITLTENVTNIDYLNLPCYPGYRKHIIEITQGDVTAYTFSISKNIANTNKLQPISSTLNSKTLIEMYTKDEGITWWIVNVIPL